MTRKPLHYLADLYYGASRYPCGWSRPLTVWGYFPADANGRLQSLFFRELLAQGFRRTFWQLVFPGQIAGLVKRIDPQADGVNEYHVRFYRDGTIDCELEVSRLRSMHWVGPRRAGFDLLHHLIDRALVISDHDLRRPIKKLFGPKPHSQLCIRH